LLYKLLSKLYLCTTEKAKLNIIGDRVMNLKSVECEGAKWVHMTLDTGHIMVNESSSSIEQGGDEFIDHMSIY
jgi:hypothetical protein